ncbi:MAG: hypothetical protein GXY88_01545 [Tissierellia bacterium]|nr:hypothetical protein [Tissierellia bacterium]
MARAQKYILISFFSIMFILFLSSTMMAQEDAISEIEERLMDISEEERRILEELFIQAQEIEELEREYHKLAEDIRLIELEIEDIEGKIDKEKKNYDERLGVLEQVLKSYQRMGPGSYIEIILDADSITNLLRRINTLRDLTRNTGELLETMDRIREELEAEKANLDEKMGLLEEKEEELRASLDKKQEAVAELERYLASLEGDREYYEEQLNRIMEMMAEIKIVFADISDALSNIIEEGKLPDVTIDISFTPEGIKGTMDEEAFKEIIASNPHIPDFVFHFSPDQVEMEFPEKNLHFIGNFAIVDGHILKFEIEEGSFYGMVLKKGTIGELFEGGYFGFDLKPLLGRNTIEDLEVKNGYIELIVDIKLF